jgi:branched-chain amino acid transport system ATP-binding protein
MMARPRLLLLDEPSLGLAPVIVDEMFRVIRDINAQGTSVLLVEQNVSIALRLAKRAYVLEEGRIAAQGEAAEMLNRPEIRKAYLGL